MEQKIFKHTREELIDMFTPISEYQEKTNEITINKCGFGTITATADYRKNMALWLQRDIENSRISKEMKERMINTIGALIHNAYHSGRLAEKKANGTFDEYVNAVAEYRIEKHNKQEAK